MKKSYYKGQEVTPHTLAIAKDFRDVFSTVPGKRVLKFLEDALHAQATTELTPFQQGQAAAYNKIVLYRDMQDEIQIVEGD